jgi:hypothetical protein
MSTTTTNASEPTTDAPEAITNESEAPTSAPEATTDVTEPTTNETAEKTEYQRPVVLPGFEEVATVWWDAVVDVHEVLLSDDAGIDRVSGAFNRELRARWDYARTLHSRGYLVPDYLAERVPVAPLWPLPELPAPARSVARAA